MRRLSIRLRIATFALSAVVAAAAVAAVFVSTGSAGTSAVHSFKVAPPFVGPGSEAFTTQSFTVEGPSTVTHVVVSFLFSKSVTIVSAQPRVSGSGTCSPASGVAKQVDCRVNAALSPGESVTFDVLFTGTGEVAVTGRVSYREGLGDSPKSPVNDTVFSSTSNVTFLSSTTDRNGLCARTFPAIVGTDHIGSSNPQSTAVELGQPAPGQPCAPITVEEKSSEGFVCGDSSCRSQASSVLFPGIGTVTIVIDTATFGADVGHFVLYYFADESDTTGEQVPQCSTGPVPATGCIQSVTASGTTLTFVLAVDGGPGIDPTYAG